MPPRNKSAAANIPTFIKREEGAYQLSITVEQWDEFVASGVLPPPSPAFPPPILRWRWRDVESRMSEQRDARPSTRRVREKSTAHKPNPFVEAVQKRMAYEVAALAQGHSKKKAKEIAESKMRGGMSDAEKEEWILEQVRKFQESSTEARRPKS